MIAELRADIAAGKILSEGPIKSPLIKPTLKRDLESGIDNSAFRRLHEEIRSARRDAAAALRLVDNPEFSKLESSVRYELLIERYRFFLAPEGFMLDSHRKTGLVFRKATTNQRWACLLVDQTRRLVASGILQPSFAVTLPGQAVRTNRINLSSVATFSPEEIVPEFQ